MNHCFSSLLKFVSNYVTALLFQLLSMGPDGRADIFSKHCDENETLEENYSFFAPDCCRKVALTPPFHRLTITCRNKLFRNNFSPVLLKLL